MNASTSRGNGKNLNLNSMNVKNKILQYLYTNTEELNLKHESITSINDLDNIRDNEYIICPRVCGTRSWILFCYIDDIYYAVSFPKHSQHRKEALKIFSIDIAVAQSFYSGTIMEGIYYKSNNVRYLIVDEVYILAGVTQMLKPKDDRLGNLSNYFKSKTNTNIEYYMYVTQFYAIDKSSLEILYSKIKSDPEIQDIIFYPKMYGLKIYNYTITDTDKIDNIIKFADFCMQKTGSPDVYNLLSCDTQTKIDIAYIPDIKTSKKCKEWFKYAKVKELKVKCQMNMEKKKWVPIEIIDDSDSEQSDTLS